MVSVGDRVMRKIYYGDGGGLLPAEEGTVVYVHPEGRFYTVEFTFPGAWGVRKFREAYLLPPGPERLAPPKPRYDQGGAHYKWDARHVIGKYLET